MLITFRTKVTASDAVVPSTTAGLRTRLVCNGGTPNVRAAISGLSKVSGSALHWFRVTIPPGTTGLQLSNIVGTIPVGADFTVRLGEFGVFNLTAMGLA